MLNDHLLKPLAYPIPTNKQVRIQHNLAYKRVENTELMADLYAPAGLSEETKLPVVVFIHGGPIRPELSMMPKDWGVYKSYGMLMAASNFIGLTFNHRLFAIEDLSKSADDIHDALQFVRDNSRRFNIDPDRVCLWGFSGGGPLLAFALRENLPFVRCVLAFYANLDIGSTIAETRAQLTEEELKRFSLVAALEERDEMKLPMFIARAGRDHALLNETIDSFVQKAITQNIPLTFFNHESGRHGFDVLDANARTNEIIAAAIAFITANVK